MRRFILEALMSFAIRPFLDDDTLITLPNGMSISPAANLDKPDHREDG